MTTGAATPQRRRWAARRALSGPALASQASARLEPLRRAAGLGRALPPPPASNTARDKAGVRLTWSLLYTFQLQPKLDECGRTLHVAPK